MRALIALFAVLSVGITATVVAEPAGASAFSGANGRIFYLSSGNIWSVTAGGTGATQLTSGLDVDFFDVSPNGRAVAFSVAASSQLPPDIYIVNAAGPLVTIASSAVIPTRPWRNLFGGAHFPSFSADGLRVAFTASSYQEPIHANNNQVFTIGVNGVQPKQLTNLDLGSGGARESSFSPAGDKIIFRITNTIYWVSPTASYTDPTAVQQLCAEGATIGHFSWKPDGTIFSYTRGFTTTYEMNSAGSDCPGKHAVIDSALGDSMSASDASWSPDGTLLVFRSGDNDLYTVPGNRVPHGTAPTKLTSSPTQNKSSTTWAVMPPPDTTDPTMAIASGPSGTVTSTTASFSFTASELVTFWCSLDGAAAKVCAAKPNFTSLKQGPHKLTVYAKDMAGNTSTSVSRSWTVSSIRMTRIVYRTTSLTAELVTLKNMANTPVALRDYKISSNLAGFTMPTFSLGGGRTVDVHTGNGSNTSSSLYMKRTSQFWPNTTGSGSLKRPNGLTVDTCSYNSAAHTSTTC
jgi:Tol biopolymer transport system component